PPGARKNASGRFPAPEASIVCEPPSASTMTAMFRFARLGLQRFVAGSAGIAAFAAADEVVVGSERLHGLQAPARGRLIIVIIGAIAGAVEDIHAVGPQVAAGRGERPGPGTGCLIRRGVGHVIPAVHASSQ